MFRALGWSAYLAWQLRKQKHIPFLSQAAILRLQSHRVRSLVQYAYRSVPYYRDTMTRMGLRPEHFDTAEDLGRLPVLERTDLQRDPEYFVSRAVDMRQCLKLESSGSSGAPKIIWHDPASIFQNAAHGERERAMMVLALGRWSGHRETVVISPIHASQPAVQDFVRTHAYIPSRAQVQRQYLLLSDSPQKNVALMNEFRPDLLYSYGSYIEMIFAYLGKTQAAWHKPKAILYNSDNLSPAIRDAIEKDFGIPVFTVYGAVEALKIGFGCGEHTGLHLNSDLYPVRILDRQGNQCQPGEAGEVILSNLVNRATVLLNFRLGDLASMKDGPCPCGRTLPQLSYPMGRVDDIVELPDGSIAHPIVFRHICLRCPGVLQYQVRQTGPAAFRVSIIAAPQADQGQMERSIRQSFFKEFGRRITAEVGFVDQVERTSRGKTPAVISLRNKNVPVVAAEAARAPEAERQKVIQ